MQYKSYVYRITNTKENKHYYGSRYCKMKNRYSENPLEDLKQYKSSSNTMKILFENYDISYFKFKIIKEFYTKEEALEYEVKLHLKFDVVNNISFYNNANQSSSGFSYSNSPSNILTYFIFDSSNHLRYTVEGNLNEFLEENNLPKSLMGSYYRKKGKPIFISYDGQVEIEAVNKGLFQYCGWYCLKNDDKRDVIYLDAFYYENIYLKEIYKQGLESAKQKRLMRTKEEQDKINKKTLHHGSDNGAFKAKTIYIPKLNKIIRFDTYSNETNIEDFLKANDLPSALLNSTNGGRPIYCSSCGRGVAKKEGYEDYIGAYMLNDGEKQDEMYKDLKKYIDKINLKDKKSKEKLSKTSIKLNQWKSRRFDIYHIEKGLIESDISLKDMISKYNSNLKIKTKENYLGMSDKGKHTLKRLNKEHLIGLYVVEIQSHKDKGIPKPV